MPTDPRTYAAELDAAMPELLALLERLVNIDSGSYHAAGVQQVIDVMSGELAKLGFEIARKPLPDRADRMTATLKLGRGKRHLLILGHADTVWPAGTVAEWPFARVGDRLTGPGVGDMKGGVVMALFALKSILARGLDGLDTIRFLLVPDEELGSIQSRSWIEDESRTADAALVLEPCRPKGGIVVQRGAVGAVFIDAAGKSAHCASYWQDGASAVKELAQMIPALEALSRPDDGIIANVGIFNGGAARQVVPHEARMHLDVRAPGPDEAAGLLAEVRKIVETRRDARVEVKMSGGFTRPAFPRAPGTLALAELAHELAGALGAPIFDVASRGGSDGSFAAALGVPTLDGLGPICWDTCSRRETVEIASIPQRGAILAGLIEGVAAGRALPRAA
jgi:glutamate carboxypeptidase